jgi:hypothetical protein
MEAQKIFKADLNCFVLWGKSFIGTGKLLKLLLLLLFQSLLLFGIYEGRSIYNASYFFVLI